MKDYVRVGLIGFGKQGSHYVRMFIEHRLFSKFRLTAIADTCPEKLQWVRDNIGHGIECFDSAEAMLESGKIDACIITTPHPMHPEHVIMCLKHGIHVMCDKPAGVHILQVQQMNREAEKHPDLVFSIMFNQRTNCAYRKLKSIVETKEYGEVRRISWTVNNWYRSHYYYDSFDWRGIWKGAYGGTIMDQCPHQIDLWQWMFGMPDKVTCRMGFGSHHDIEVEDEVSAILEYKNGCMGTFNSSTSIPNGQNILEVNLDAANITVKGNSVFVEKFCMSEPKWQESPRGIYEKMAVESPVEIPTDGKNLQHKGVLEAWINRILGKGNGSNDGKEGLASVMLSNAMYMSAFTGKTVDLPLDGEEYYKELQKRVAVSKSKKPVTDLLGPVRETFQVKDPKQVEEYFGIVERV